ncbi:MAG: PEP-CTERM sorting domain-containing protein [Chthoniobacteraceae bacterium]
MHCSFVAGSIFNQNAGGVLNNDGAFLMSGNTFNYNGGNITGNPIMLENSTLVIAPGSTGTADFILQSSGGGTGTYSGNLAPAQTLTLRGSDSSQSFVSVANGFSNFSTITLDSMGTKGATLVVSTGALTNTVNGEIALRVGSGTNLDRTLSADVVNDGVFTVEPGINARLAKSAGVFTNNNTVDIAATATLSFVAGSIFNQNAGGVLNNDGAFLMSGNTFNYNGGNITGNPIMLENSTLVIAPGSTGTADFILQSSGGGTGTYSGDLDPAQTLTLRGNDSSQSFVSVANGFTNGGSITLDSIGLKGATLNVTSGVLSNAPTGEINFQQGTGSNMVRTLAVDTLDNAGSLTVEENVVAGLLRNSATYTNSGTITLHDGGSLEVQGAGVRPFTNLPSGSIEGTGTLDVSGPGVAFSNEGEISPGFGAGVLNISGSVPFASTASLRIEIGGPALGTDYDQLAVTDAVSLDGDLMVSLFNGYTPAPTDTFTILTGGTVSGLFANAPSVVSFNGGQFGVTYHPDSVVLGNFVIPEPSTAALLAVGAMLGWTRRRRWW